MSIARILIMGFCLTLAPALAAELSEGISQQLEGFEYQERLVLPTPDESSPKMKGILQGRPLIRGGPGKADPRSSGASAPGYLRRVPDRMAQGSGWQSSGGGGAMLCFNDDDRFQLALKQAKTDGLLSDETINQADVVYTHERWEQNGQDLDFALDYAVHMIPWEQDQLSNIGSAIQDFGTISRQQHLDRIDQLIFNYSPVFFQRLTMIRAMMPRRDWIPAKLQPVEDFRLLLPANLMPPYLKKCIHWPVVVRKFDFTPGTKNPVQVYFDEALLKKLSAFDQALLEYHEQVYALANYIGLQDSNQVRAFVREVFSLRFWSIVSNHSSSVSNNARYFQRFVSALFVDYPLFFADELDAAAAGAPEGTPGSWHKSYSAPLLRAFDHLRECIHGLKERSDEAIKECSRQGYDEILQDRDGGMRAETAFLLVVRFILDFEDVIKGSEWFLIFDTGSPSALHPIQRKQFEKACTHIQSASFGDDRLSKQYPHLPKKAREYCHLHFGG